MRDFVKRDLAMLIRHDLYRFSVNVLSEYALEVVDDIFRKFCQLNNIGVFTTQNGPDDIIYHFVQDNGFTRSSSWGDYSLTEVKDTRLFVSLKANHDWEAMATRAMRHIEKRFGFKSWQSYLDKEYARPVHNDSLDAMRYMLVPRGCGKSNWMSQKVVEYIENDIKATGEVYKQMINEKFGAPKRALPTIKKVIFNDPATVILWEDNTKTVVKVSDGEVFDPEKGLAMAMCKKALGNDGRYYEVFKKHLNNWEKTLVEDLVKSLMDADKVWKKNFKFSFDLPEGTMEPMDLEESTDAVTIDTEAEQYTVEAPKEVSDNRMIINDVLLSLMRDTGCLNITFIPDTSQYCIEKRGCKNVEPYYVHVESPTEEISPTALTQLKLDICKHFDI